MDLFLGIVQIIAVLAVPTAIYRLRRTRAVSLLGMITVAYICGALYSALRMLAGAAFRWNVTAYDEIIQDISFAAIALAIPLLLSDARLREVKKLSGTMLRAFGTVVVTVILVSLGVYFLYSRKLENGNVLTGMAIGLYTGGTPNLNSVGAFFRLDTDIISISNISDMMIGGVFYFFLLLFAKKLLGSFLKAKSPAARTDTAEAGQPQVPDSVNLRDKALWRNLLFSLGAVLAGAGIAFVIHLLSDLKFGDLLVPVLFITVTAAGILLSFVPKVSACPSNQPMGSFLIIVFSFAIGSVIDFGNFRGNFLPVFLHFTVITVVSFLVSAAAAKILRVPADELIIAYTAGIYGPAFVPSLSGQLKRKDLLMPGLICGSLGYAIGTFLGIFIAYVL